MNTTAAAEFLVLTIALTIGLGATLAAAFRANIGENWETQRCDPYVVPIAGFFKPSADPRTAAQFATDNWNYCQKQYIQNGVRIAAQAPKALADAEAATVGIMQDMSSVVADVFFNLWNVCYETYSAFMEKMKTVARLFQNFFINLYGITERLNAAAISIIYGLISLIISVVNSIQVTLIVAIIVVGIILIMQILLFFLFLPISGLIITVTAVVSVAVVVMATAIAAATVSEMFGSGACFVGDTPVILATGETCAIRDIRLGDVLMGGGRVTAIHKFRTTDTVYDLDGVCVSGDHLIDGARVSERPDALPLAWAFRHLWCLTTTTRRIPCKGVHGPLLFADWEEIAAEDTEALREWHDTVWRTLNTTQPHAPSPANATVLDSEAGLSPDTEILCLDWLGYQTWRSIHEIVVGDRVWDGESFTPVLGKVVLAGDLTTDAVDLDGSIVSCATWTLQEGLWAPVRGPKCEIHPITWEHLYTRSGTFMVGGPGGINVRDASDIGLDRLRSLVDTVVLEKTDATT